MLEKIPGRTFRQLLESGESVSPEIASRMVADFMAISDALDAAGVVHRDLRPSNFIVSAEGRVTVIDFQFAILRDAATESSALAKRHFDLLSHLGGDSALADGIWNDRLAMAKCISALPDCPGKADAIARLESLAKGADYAACLPASMRGGILKLRWKLRVKRWLGKFAGRSLSKKEARMERHAAHVLAKWRFA